MQDIEVKTFRKTAFCPKCEFELAYYTISVTGKYVHKCVNESCSWGTELSDIYPRLIYKEVYDGTGNVS